MLNDCFSSTIGAMRHIYNRVVTEQQKLILVKEPSPLSLENMVLFGILLDSSPFKWSFLSQLFHLLNDRENNYYLC